MKKSFIIFITLAVLGPALYAGGLHFGLISAVKSQVNELDKAVKAKKDAQAAADFKVAHSIVGTAARGWALSSEVVTIKDSAGVSKSVRTDANGKYFLDFTGLTPPLLITITDGTSVYFSIAFSSGVCNISPATDLVVRSYFRINLGIADLKAAFDSSFSSLGSLSLALEQKINAVRDVITNIISSMLARNGLDAVTFDIFISPFDANSIGFDGVLDQLQIVVSGSSVTIRDTYAGTQLSTFTYTGSGQKVQIVKDYNSTLRLSTDAESPYKLLLAHATGGFPPYTFMLATGVGFQPMGMTLSQEGSDCYLKGTPSKGSQSPFSKHFGITVKDLGGNEATTENYDYIISSGTEGGASGSITVSGISYVLVSQGWVAGVYEYVYNIKANGTVTGPAGAECSFGTNPIWADPDEITITCSGWTGTPVHYQQFMRNAGDPETTSWSATWNNYIYDVGLDSTDDVEVSAYLFAGDGSYFGLLADDEADVKVPH